MKFYEITYMIEDEQQEWLLALAKCYEKVNGWNEKNLAACGYRHFRRRYRNKTSVFGK